MPGGVSYDFQCDGLSSSPYASVYDYNLGNLHNSDMFTVMHFNIRSLPAHFDDLILMLHNYQTMKISGDGILLCETFLTDLNCNLFQIKGYNFYEIHRKNQKGGGVGCFY